MKWLHRLLALCALSLPCLPALAFTEADLLPVDQAFALSAHADDSNGIELQWKIADGYYLYRHRIAVSPVGTGFRPGPLTLPEGHKKHDEFFGNVETYRGHLSAVLAGQADPGVRSVTVEVRYQGCADAGVCYPPQKRRIEVKLPADTGAAAGVSAATGGAAGLPRASALPGAGPGLPGLPGGGMEALPLPAEQAFAFEAIVGDGNTLLLRFTPAPGYYLYRDRTSLALEGSKQVDTGMPQWPPGRSHHDEHFGDVVVYFDQAEVTLPLLRRTTDPADITLVATFQGCQTDGICYPPMTRRVKLSLPAGKLTPPDQASAAPLPIQPLSGNARPKPAAANAALDAPDASAHNDGRSLPPSPRQNLFWVLLAALAGGLVLNLMPCVLPILSLKVLGLAHSGESRARARSHALWYSLGVLVSFSAIGALVIALRAAGQAAGWGFQLQQPWFVAMLAYLMFAIGLSLSGLFTLGVGGGIGQSLASRNGPVGDFFTGVLACVVASPCIAPFMGTALAYAFAAPALAAMLVFVVLGLGLALPFLLIGFVPSLARRLPSPGPWMETLKQVLAFPMYLTAIWLLWVLGKQRGVDALALVLVGATLLALGLWWFERSRWRSHRTGLALSSLMLLLALLPVWGVTRIAPPRAAVAQAGEVAYSPQLLDRLRADNRVVFVNMTADWCVTCKANERHVLGSDEFRDTLRRVDAVYMTGDWTNEDPAISAFLRQHQAVGVPLYVVYGPGAPPTILPTVLTQAIVEDALLRAAR